jgi:carbon storage regulator
MLILTRKQEQSIIINDDIVITVLAVDGGRVKLGIRAPSEISVLREEVQRAVSGENRRAATLAPDRSDMEAMLRTMRHTKPADPPVG